LCKEVLAALQILNFAFELVRMRGGFDLGTAPF
jgi:hypothetical protein